MALRWLPDGQTRIRCGPLDGYARYHLRSDVRRSTPDRGAFAAADVSYSAAFSFCVVALNEELRRDVGVLAQATSVGSLQPASFVRWSADKAEKSEFAASDQQIDDEHDQQNTADTDAAAIPHR